MDSIPPGRLLALVRPGNDLILRRIRNLKRCVQACGCNITTPRYACKMPRSCVSARRALKKQTGKKREAQPGASQKPAKPSQKPATTKPSPKASHNQPKASQEASQEPTKPSQKPARSQPKASQKPATKSPCRNKGSCGAFWEFRLRSPQVGIPTSLFCDMVLARSLTESPCRQSCARHRIAPVNPALDTGLLHSTLRWQQDCPCVPAFSFRRTNWEDQAFSHDRVHQQAILGPHGAPGAVHRHLPRAFQIGQDRGSDQLDSGAVSSVFERIYIFSPSINIDDGWIPVKKYIEEDLGVNTEREQAYWDEWDEPALRRIIQPRSWRCRSCTRS